MKTLFKLTTSLLFIANLFVACSPSPNVKEVRCTKENINKCNQEQKIKMVEEMPELIQYINKPNKEIQIEALKQDPSLIRFIDKPSKEAMLY